MSNDNYIDFMLLLSGYANEGHTSFDKIMDNKIGHIK